MRYRDEQKYTITARQAAILSGRLAAVMKKDLHSGRNGTYNVRSLYFDDIYDSAFYENRAGLDDRKKIRLRVYGRNFDFIRLEIKGKRNGYTEKRQMILSRRQAENFINTGKIPLPATSQSAVANRLFRLCRTRIIKPKIIVEYDRQAFADPVGNVRVTFDRNIRQSAKISRFFDENIYALPILPAGRRVLEVKYDEILPGYIKDILFSEKLSRNSFSKYYLSILNSIGDYNYEF